MPGEPSTKAKVLYGLRKKQAEHAQYLCYRATGAHRLFDRLLGAGERVKDLELGSANYYDPKSRSLRLEKYNLLNPFRQDEDLAWHELAHAFEHQKGLYSSVFPWADDHESSEGFAMFVDIVTTALRQFESFEDAVKAGNQPCEYYQKRWLNIWKFLTENKPSLTLSDRGRHRRWVGMDSIDAKRVFEHLGVKFSCVKLAKMYEAELAKKGIVNSRSGPYRDEHGRWGYVQCLVPDERNELVPVDEVPCKLSCGMVPLSMH